MRKSVFGFLALCLGFACSAVAAEEYRIGDEISFVEGQKMPPAPPGTEWCLIQMPAVYETVATRTFMVPVPAEYAMKEEEHPAVPEHKTATVVPATFQVKAKDVQTVPAHRLGAKLASKQMEIEVCPAYEEWRAIPARFQEVKRQIVVVPVKKTFEQVECGGDNICWTVVDVPEKVRTIVVKELVQDGRAEKVTVPARKQAITVQEVVTDGEADAEEIPAVAVMVVVHEVAGAASVRWQTVPAQTQTVTVEFEAKPAGHKEQTVSERRLVEPEQLVWRLQAVSSPAADDADGDAEDPDPEADTDIEPPPTAIEWRSFGRNRNMLNTGTGYTF